MKTEWNQAELHALAEKDHKAWVRFIKDYKNLIFTIINNWLQSHGFNLDLADDVFQYVILQMLQNDCSSIRLYDPEKGKFSTYVGLIASTKIRQWFRQRKLSRHPILAGTPKNIVTDIKSRSPKSYEIEDTIIGKELLDMVDLDYIRYHVLGYTYKELVDAGQKDYRELRQDFLSLESELKKQLERI